MMQFWPSVVIKVCAIAAAALLVCAADPPASAGLIHFRLDTAATKMTVACAEPLAWLRGDAVGTMRVTSGDVWGDLANPAATAGVKVTIDAASYDSGNGLRDRAVKDGTLEVERFPVITFESHGLRDVKLASGKIGSAIVAGRLTLHGVTLPFDVPVKVTVLDAGKLVTDGDLAFDYTPFGIQPPSILWLSAGRIVKVHFHVVAVKVDSQGRLGPKAPDGPRPRAAS